ncbi:HAS barrel domain protein [Lyngbya aestuarii BL J]|uniref:HAS barrel domain protein n=1 Tax=Lyngbya aestuarii BL J TaxID=1348334 RepID=U7QQB5_9CYAN|nr:HAS-barrel domain-containing protein [Lyngbya aestuarii]ERT09447.1 HAS barrel domain protein [Lyngbya aestuarii BL J]
MRLPFPQFSTTPRHPRHIGEVIETTTCEFLAQCLESEDLTFPIMPPFGSWIKSSDEESGNQIYAIVYHVTTSPIDSVHRARALGLSLQELREEQPQIFAMLKTEFRAAIVGFETPATGNNGIEPPRGLVYQYIPPRPPQIHQAVYHCESTDIIYFSEEFDFLRTLLQVNQAPVESLVAAAIRHIYQLRNCDRSWLVEAGRTLSLVLRDDYDRLRVILKQIHP